MQIQEVVTNRDKIDFIKVPIGIYNKDPHWIRPLDKDIEDVFDSKKNKYFKHGEAVRWILKDENGLLIGRVAGFINRKTSNTFDQPTGGMGFFECVDCKEAAFLLFDTCKKWLTARGMEAMDGPVNFGEKDRWWGLLVDGFYEPTYAMNYNPRYYRRFFEEYGFKTYYEQYNYLMKVGDRLPEKYYERAERILRNPLYTAEHISKRNLEKYAEDFRYVYNKAWGRHDNFKGMTKGQTMAMLKTIEPVMDENLIWFAYYDNEPVGFFIMLPELNQIFKYMNGKFGWWQKIKFLWYRRKGVCRKVFGMAFGIIPEYQGRGVEGFIIMAAAKEIQASKHYDEFEMTWVGDFNPRMIHMVESLGAHRFRTYVTFRKLFDENKPFNRAPIIR